MRILIIAITAAVIHFTIGTIILTILSKTGALRDLRQEAEEEIIVALWPLYILIILPSRAAVTSARKARGEGKHTRR